MDRRLRIVSVFQDLYIGGDENRALAFAKALDRRRFELSLVVIRQSDGRNEEQFGPMRQRFQDEGIEVIDLGEAPGDIGITADEGRTHPSQAQSSVLEKGRTLARRVRRLAQVLRQQRADVVDAHLSDATLYSTLAGGMAGVKGVVTTDYGVRSWDRRYFRTLAPLVFRKIDALICDSRAKSEEMRTWLAIPRLRCEVIPNGIFPPSTTLTRESARRLFGLPEDPRVRVIGQISRLIPFKGHRMLLAAAREVLNQERDVAFLICGYRRDPAYQLELEREATSLGIANRVKFVSYPGPIGDVWAAIDIHVHASQIESSPIAIAEGMALARPAVVTGVGGIPELVEHERSGLVVPAGAPQALANALLVLLRYPETARRLGAAAHERYRNQHRPECMARALEDLFMSVAFKHRDSNKTLSKEKSMTG